MAARREQRVMHGGVASEVAAFFLFLLLDEQRKKKELKKYSYSHVWIMQHTEEFMSQLTPTYIYRPLKSVRANAWIT